MQILADCEFHHSLVLSEYQHIVWVYGHLIVKIVLEVIDGSVIGNLIGLEQIGHLGF